MIFLDLCRCGLMMVGLMSTEEMQPMEKHYTVQVQVSPPAATVIVCRGDQIRANYRIEAEAATYTEAQRLAAEIVLGR